MTLMADVFTKLRSPKKWLDQYLKSPVSEASVEKQHGKCAQTFFKFEGQLLLPYLSITGKTIFLQEVSVSYMQNLKTIY